MKHFLPSSVMLTPFLVKYYDEEQQGTPDSQEKHAAQVECSTDSTQDSTEEEREPTLTE